MDGNTKVAIVTVHGGSSERGRSLDLSSAVVFVLSIMLVAFLFFYQRSMYWLPFLKCCSLESGHAHFEALIVASLLRGIQWRVQSSLRSPWSDHWRWLLQPRSEGPCSHVEAELWSHIMFMAFYLLHSSYTIILPWFLATQGIDTVDPTFRENIFSLYNWKHTTGLAHRRSGFSCTSH